MSVLAYVLIFGVCSAFAVSTLWALWWAIRAGQFDDPRAAARSILEGEDLQREIDRSCRGPVLYLFASGVGWLLVGTLLAMLASIKLHSPLFIADTAWLTFGRVRPAHLTVVAYGWAGSTGLGVLLWLMCRLCRVKLPAPWVMIAAGGVWNLGVILGTIAILAGRGNGVEWIEYPPLPSFLLFLAFGIFGLWGLLTFARRRPGYVYVSQWYLFATLFWFPWVYATVQVLVLSPWAARGVAQESIHWWFGHNVLGVFFTPIGLAAAYYMIPRIAGRPVYSYHLSLLGFWTLALFYTWAGAHHLVAGPVPAWLVTVSTVSSVMMFIPVTTTALNHHMTMRGHFGLLRQSMALRFVVAGAMIYTAVSYQGSLMSIRALNEPTHFTHHTIAHAHLGLYGFYTLILFGCMYHITPLLTGRAWGSTRLASVHFWGVALGMALMFGGLTLGGFIQGFEMNQASGSWNELVGRDGLWAGTRRFIAGFEPQNGAVPFMTIVRDLIPWLWSRSVAGMLMTVGHIAFAALLVRNLLAMRRPEAGEAQG